jgi:hypothetical protein
VLPGAAGVEPALRLAFSLHRPRSCVDRADVTAAGQRRNPVIRGHDCVPWSEDPYWRRPSQEILTGSVLSTLLATVVLRTRNRHYRRLCAEENRDGDADGVPDIYQTGDPHS